MGTISILRSCKWSVVAQQYITLPTNSATRHPNDYQPDSNIGPWPLTCTRLPTITVRLYRPPFGGTGGSLSSSYSFNTAVRVHGFLAVFHVQECAYTLLHCTIATVIPGKAASAEWDEPKKRRKGTTFVFNRHTRENIFFANS